MKSKTKTKTTPIVNEPMAGNLNDYAGKVSNFLGTDPAQYVATASPLQQQAFSGAQNLGGWQGPAQQAINMAQNAGGAGASTYQAPKLAQASQAQGVNIAAAPQARGESLLTNLNAYMDPYVEGVVESTLANYDAYSGKQAAALKAQQARAGAFGGSQAGMTYGSFEADRGRNRMAAEYGVRSDAFNRGAAFSGQDADRRQGANFFNIGNTQQRNLAQAGMDSTRSMFNTAAQNQTSLAQAEMDAEERRYNAAAGEAALQRAMQAAGLTANIGADMGQQSRADLGLTADLGQVQYLIDQARLNAVPTQLQVAGGLYGMIPQASYIGQNSVSKTSGGLGAPLLGAGLSALSMAIPGLGGGGSTGPFGMKM